MPHPHRHQDNRRQSHTLYHQDQKREEAQAAGLGRGVLFVYGLHGDVTFLFPICNGFISIMIKLLFLLISTVSEKGRKLYC